MKYYELPFTFPTLETLLAFEEQCGAENLSMTTNPFFTNCVTVGVNDDFVEIFNRILEGNSI